MTAPSHLREFGRVCLLSALAVFSLSMPLHTFGITLNPGDILVADPDFIHAQVAPFEAIDTAVWKVDPVTGQRELLTGRGQGDGAPLRTATQVVVDRLGRITVADNYGWSLLRVDPISGDRTYLTYGDTVGGGFPYQTISALALDPDNSLVVLDHLSENIFRVDPNTGIRSLISGPSRGNGPRLAYGWLGVGGDGAIWATGYDSGTASGIIKIDPLTGDRQLVSGLGAGSGPDFFSDIRDLTMIDDHTAMVINQGTLFHVDLVSGDRTRLELQGPVIDTPSALVRNPSGKFVVTDEANGNVFLVDPITGTDTLLSANSPGFEFWMPQDVTLVSAVPEPATALLAAMAILVAPALLRRRRHHLANKLELDIIPDTFSVRFCPSPVHSLDQRPQQEPAPLYSYSSLVRGVVYFRSEA